MRWRLIIDEGYKPFLALPGEEPEEGHEDVPDETKMVLLLESRDEIIAAERGLREMEILRDRGVEGSGELESAYSVPFLPSHYPSYRLRVASPRVALPRYDGYGDSANGK